MPSTNFPPYRNANLNLSSMSRISCDWLIESLIARNVFIHDTGEARCPVSLEPDSPYDYLIYMFFL